MRSGYPRVEARHKRLYSNREELFMKDKDVADALWANVALGCRFGLTGSQGRKPADFAN
jgi:hypothetical protein